MRVSRSGAIFFPAVIGPKSGPISQPLNLEQCPETSRLDVPVGQHAILRSRRDRVDDAPLLRLEIHAKSGRRPGTVGTRTNRCNRLSDVQLAVDGERHSMDNGWVNPLSTTPNSELIRIDSRQH